MGMLNSEGKSIEDSPVSASQMAELLMLIEQNVISGKIAKTVFDDMVLSGKNPKEIVAQKGLVQVTDASAIESVVDGAWNRSSVGAEHIGTERRGLHPT